MDIQISKRSLHPELSKNDDIRLQRRSLSDLAVCAVCSIQRLVGLGGLEPPASPLSGVRSNHLSYRPKVVHVLQIGGASRDRTDDPLLAKQVLSQLSYGPDAGRWTPRRNSECR